MRLPRKPRRVEDEGGRVHMAVRGGNGYIVYAAIQDLAGAYLELSPA
jgi:predicted enzyme related to lactoylglutathione lyase